MGSAGAQFHFHCPAGGQALDVPADSIGADASCAHCNASITVPDTPECPLADEDPLATTTSAAGAATPPLVLPARAAAVLQPPAWREVVRDCVDLVPLIECAAGIASGLLVSRDGLVLTSRHVVSNAQTFMLKFHDGSRAKGVTVHAHGTRDLAVLRAAIRRERCFDIRSCVADEIEAGDDVLAIGHPRGLAFTATRGIVSEPHRLLVDGEYVQSDVAINPGNSGGPLFDRAGKLVGINTQMERDAQGLGFAIGGREAQAYALFVLDQLARKALHFPSDEEIAAAERSMTPWDVVLAAAKASALPFEPEKLPGGQPCLQVRSPGGMRFAVHVGGNLLVVAGCVAPNLSDQQVRNTELLLRLIRWQNELCGPAFDIVNNGLFLTFRRGVEGLDVNEAREAILRVGDALDHLRGPVHQMLGR